MLGTDLTGFLTRGRNGIKSQLGERHVRGAEGSERRVLDGGRHREGHGGIDVEGDADKEEDWELHRNNDDVLRCHRVRQKGF